VPTPRADQAQGTESVNPLKARRISERKLWELSLSEALASRDCYKKTDWYVTLFITDLAPEISGKTPPAKHTSIFAQEDITKKRRAEALLYNFGNNAN